MPNTYAEGQQIWHSGEQASLSCGQHSPPQVSDPHPRIMTPMNNRPRQSSPNARRKVLSWSLCELSKVKLYVIRCVIWVRCIKRAAECRRAHSIRALIAPCCYHGCDEQSSVNRKWILACFPHGDYDRRKFFASAGWSTGATGMRRKIGSRVKAIILMSRSDPRPQNTHTYASEEWRI